MKAKFFILFVVVLLACPIRQQAQSFTPGITVGVSTTSVNMSDIPNAAINSVKGNNIMGFEGGFFGRFSFGPVFIKPMVLVSYQYGTVKFNNADGTVNSPNFDYGMVEVPLLFGIRFFGFLRIEGGPVYNWIYSTQYSNENSVKVETSGLGYRVGANVEFGRVNLGLAYQGLNNTSSGSSTATFSTPNELIFSLGVCLGEKK